MKKSKQAEGRNALPPLVLIEWLDAHSGRGWQTSEQLHSAAEPLYCRSVGWMVVDGKDCKVLVPHISGERNGPPMHTGCGDLTIPVRSIIRIRPMDNP